MIVPKGNPLGLKSLEDLTDDDIRVIIGSLDLGMGRMCVNAIGDTDVYEEITDNYVFIEETKCIRIPQSVDEGLVDVALGCMPSSYRVDGVEFIEVAELNRSEIIPIGVLEFSENKELAQKFVDIAASDFGKSVMEKHGFEPLEG
jgi:molybdate transport system substrate-binding protein